MKKIILFLFVLFCVIPIVAQNQEIDGNLTMRGDVILHGGDISSTFGEYGQRLYFGRPFENTDNIWLARLNVGNDVSELRLNLGDFVGDKFMIGRTNSPHTPETFSPIFSVYTSGYVTVGGIENPGVKLFTNGRIESKSLEVNGTIRAREVKIEATGWADFVFSPDYKLPALKEIETHIKEKGTLPDIPSEKEVLENGIDVGDMQAKLLQKIEELTLHVIELKKENEAQDALIKKLIEDKK